MRWSATSQRFEISTRQSELLQAVCEFARIGVHPVSSRPLQLLAVESARLKRDRGRFHPSSRQDIPYGVSHDEAVFGLSFELLRSQAKEIRSRFRSFDVIRGQDRAVGSV